MAKSSKDITRDADKLALKLAKIRKEARLAKKMEDQREAEAQRQEEISDALEFVKYAKMVFYPGSEETVYVYLSHCLEDMKSGNCTWGYNADAPTGNDDL